MNKAVREGLQTGAAQCALLKSAPVRGEAVDVRRTYTGVAAQAAYPIVHIVHADHQNIGAGLRRGLCSHSRRTGNHEFASGHPPTPTKLLVFSREKHNRACGTRPAGCREESSVKANPLGIFIPVHHLVEAGTHVVCVLRVCRAALEFAPTASRRTGVPRQLA